MAYRVLVADKLAAEGLEVLRASGMAFDEKVGLKPEQLATEVPNYDALIVRSGAKVTAKVLENPGKLPPSPGPVSGSITLTFPRPPPRASSSSTPPRPPPSLPPNTRWR